MAIKFIVKLKSKSNHYQYSIIFVYQFFVFRSWKNEFGSQIYQGHIQ